MENNFIKLLTVLSLELRFWKFNVKSNWDRNILKSSKLQALKLTIIGMRDSTIDSELLGLQINFKDGW